MPLFLIPILVGLIAQISKLVFDRNYKKHLNKKGHRMPRYGGMPSAHTAFAFSLATVVAMAEGIMNVPFAITAAVVIFILDDALRMRIFLGRHGRALRLLIAQLPPEDRKEFPHLESRLGHKAVEVIAGGILGIVVTIILMWFV